MNGRRHGTRDRRSRRGGHEHGRRRRNRPAKNGRIAFVRLRRRHRRPVERDLRHERRRHRRADDHAAALRLPGRPPQLVTDGSRIVFQRCALSGGACLVWSTSPDGTELERLSPRLSGRRDSTGVCRRPEPGLLAGRTAHRVHSNQGQAGADAGGREAEASPRRRPPGSSRGSPYGVAWSPNGKQLVFASVNDAAAAQSRSTAAPSTWSRANGTGVRRLDALGAPGGRPPGLVARRQAHPLSLVLESARRRRSRTSTRFVPTAPGSLELTHFQDSDRVLDGSYSPDGASIVFSTTARATHPTVSMPDIAVMRADGTGVRPVTRSANWDASPDWGPQR